MNLGALTLQALFENWPSAQIPSDQETRTVEKGDLVFFLSLSLSLSLSLLTIVFFLLTSPGSSPAPPPQFEDLMELCGGDALKDWEGIGKSLSIPESKLEDILHTHKGDVEKSKEQLFKVLSHSS